MIFRIHDIRHIFRKHLQLLLEIHLQLQTTPTHTYIDIMKTQ